MIKKKFFTDILDVSESITGDSPKGLRAFLLPLCFFGILLFTIIVGPFIITYKFFKKDKEAPFKKLEKELFTKWHTESSEAALLELREWHEKLNDNPSLFHFKGAHFEPYGRFRFNDYINILNLLYCWEVQHQNFNEACEICDIYLSVYKDSGKGRESKSFQYWAVQKAQIIKSIQGHTEARKYLLQYLDPQHRDCPINQYFEELRSEDKNSF